MLTAAFCHCRRRPRRCPLRPVRPLRHLRHRSRGRSAQGDPFDRHRRGRQRGPPGPGTAGRARRLRPAVRGQHRPYRGGAGGQRPRAPPEDSSQHNDRKRPGPAPGRAPRRSAPLAAQAPEPLSRRRHNVIRPLPLLTPAPRLGAGCAKRGSCGRPSTGLDEATKARVAAHPCYNQEAHQYYARNAPRGRSQLQRSVQLLQPQVRLRQ